MTAYQMLSLSAATLDVVLLYIAAALRAKHGVLCQQAGKFLPFDETVLGSLESRGLKLAAEPTADSARIYEKMLDAYFQLERHVQQGTTAK